MVFSSARPRLLWLAACTAIGAASVSEGAAPRPSHVAPPALSQMAVDEEGAEAAWALPLVPLENPAAAAGPIVVAEAIAFDMRRADYDDLVVALAARNDDDDDTDDDDGLQDSLLCMAKSPTFPGTCRNQHGSLRCRPQEVHAAWCRD